MAARYHLGCGPHIKEGFVNVDLYNPKAQVKADMLTMAYEPAEHIESHHSFEHLGFVDGMVVLVKWTEALVPGGVLVIDVPDPLAIMLKAYGSTDPHIHAAAMRLIHGSQEAAWAYHINGWTGIWLAHVLDTLGFKDFQRREYCSGGPLFPNCGAENTAIKGLVYPRSELVHKAHILLGYYLHPSEVGLHAMFCNQFDRRLG